MLSVSSITLFQFKNYTNKSFDFSDRIIGIWGNNGAGKTNLLDAIHYLCFTKSYFTRQDANNVQQGKSGFRLQGQFQLSGKNEEATCILRENNKKEFSINGEWYERFSQHIGRYPCVIIAPDDSILITGSSEERRKFIDSLLSQLDPKYLQSLINYNKIVQQRNSLLRSIAETFSKDYSLLDVLDQQLAAPCSYIFDQRKEFLVSFLPKVKHQYAEISMQAEDIQLLYESQLMDASMQQLLAASRQKDLAWQRTSVGIHRDEIEINLGIQSFRNIASQGQRKSLLFALKLAELDVLKKEKGFAPLLLLDDVFEKLDETRINNLLNKVCTINDGQVFITDTNHDRLDQHLASLDTPYQLIGL